MWGCHSIYAHMQTPERDEIASDVYSVWCSVDVFYTHMHWICMCIRCAHPRKSQRCDCLLFSRAFACAHTRYPFSMAHTYTYQCRNSIFPRNIYISNWWVIKLTQTIHSCCSFFISSFARLFTLFFRSSARSIFLSRARFALFSNSKCFRLVYLECAFYTIHSMRISFSLAHLSLAPFFILCASISFLLHVILISVFHLFAYQPSKPTKIYCVLIHFITAIWIHLFRDSPQNQRNRIQREMKCEDEWLCQRQTKTVKAKHEHTQTER